MKVNKRILVIGVLLGLITVLFLRRYINSINKEEEGVAATSYSQVVVAQKTIPAHVKITEDMVKIEPIPKDAVHPDTILSLEEVIGGISKAEIINVEQVLSGRVVIDGIEASLSYRIPENMRAITIPVNELVGVANNIVVGDKIDILVTYDMEETITYTQLQNIEVAAIGSFKPKEEVQAGEQPHTITILVNPAQAEVIAYANIEGQFHLLLRNPIDNKKNDLDYYSIDNFQSFRVR